jgi:F-type H+-transporting ATPase subunit a
MHCPALAAGDQKFNKKTLVKNFTMGQLLRTFEAVSAFGPAELAFLGVILSPMRLIRIIVLLSVFAGVSFGLNAQTASTAAPDVRAQASPQAAKESQSEAPVGGLPERAGEIFHIGPFPVTNSMLVTWLVAIGVIIFAQCANRNMKEVPDGPQNFWEWLVESLYHFLEGVVGADLVKKTFWFFATIFIFIAFTNLFGLIPGVGTIGWGEPGKHGFEVTRGILRGGNADLNMTLAMSAIFMVLWFIWALQSNGIWGFAYHIWGPKGESSGVIKYMMIVVFFVVGFLELLSIAFRPVSLSFRLYGNIFAGENLLDALSRTIQHPAWARDVFSVLLPVPFYFLELLVGIVQALVFMLLTAVFTALICMHEEGHEKAPHG